MVSVPPTNLDHLTRFACYGVQSGYYNVREKFRFTKEETSFIDAILQSSCSVIKEAISRLKQIFEQKCFISKEPLLYALVRIIKSSPQGEPHSEITKLRHSAFMLARSVCETAEDLFMFLHYEKQISECNKVSWGRGTRKLILHFYDNRSAKELVQEATRCKSVRAFSHKDLLKQSHIDRKSKEKGKSSVAQMEFLFIAVNGLNC